MDEKPAASATEQRRDYHHGDLRRALLKAADAELTDKGVEGFSLRGVAKRADVSHAAPAHHFGNTEGLLTALAAEGFRRFIAKQEEREADAQNDPVSRHVASGLGYVDFALSNPALFNLMFTSERTDRDEDELCNAAAAAFDKLVSQTKDIVGRDPREDISAMTDVVAAWAMVHGLASLMNSGRIAVLQDMPIDQRDRVLADIISRSIADRATDAI
ncbi:MAG: TetR/AcrR family transcriptional regulator [Rhizobiaceae bacterium]